MLNTIFKHIKPVNEHLRSKFIQLANKFHIFLIKKKWFYEEGIFKHGLHIRKIIITNVIFKNIPQKIKMLYAKDCKKYLIFYLRYIFNLLLFIKITYFLITREYNYFFKFTGTIKKISNVNNSMLRDSYKK